MGERKQFAIALSQRHQKEELLYAVLSKYLKEHPDFEDTLMEEDKKCGIYTIAPEGFTGITVDLIETSRLQSDFMDPHLPKPKDTSKRLIVNIDYAFGKTSGAYSGMSSLAFWKQCTFYQCHGKSWSSCWKTWRYFVGRSSFDGA